MTLRKPHILLASLLLSAISVGGLTASAHAQYREDLPQDNGPMVAVPNPIISEKPNALLPADLPFKDSTGASVTLGDYFNHNKPVVLSLVYFSCPLVCGLNQTGLVGAIQSGPRNLALGKDYDVIVVSIDPDDTPATAATKRENYLKIIGRPASQPGFTYLTGSAADIKTLADTIGFGYHENPKPYGDSGKFAHSTGYFICTPDGHIAQTIGGVVLEPDSLHNSLINASQGHLTRGFVYTIAFSCGAMRLVNGHYEANPWFFAGTAGGIVSIMFMATFLTILFRSDSKRKLIEGPTQEIPDTQEPAPSTKDQE